MERIVEKAKVDELLEREPEFVLFKHSLTCPISASAEGEVEEFEKISGTPVYMIPIQEAREVSNYAADRLQTKHESPQVFYIRGGSMVWNGSHFDITKDALDGARTR